MVALRASRLVCSAMSRIRSMTVTICSEARARLPTWRLAPSASSLAPPTIALARARRAEISVIESVRLSAAFATCWTLPDASCEAVSARPISEVAATASPFSMRAAVSSVWTPPPTVCSASASLASKAVTISSIRRCRARRAASSPAAALSSAARALALSRKTATGACHVADLVAALDQRDLLDRLGGGEAAHRRREPQQGTGDPALDEQQGQGEAASQGQGAGSDEQIGAALLHMEKLGIERGTAGIVGAGDPLQGFVQSLAVAAVAFFIAHRPGGGDRALARQANHLATEGDELLDASGDVGEAVLVARANQRPPVLHQHFDLAQTLQQQRDEALGTGEVLAHIDAARFHHDAVDQAVDTLGDGGAVRSGLHLLRRRRIAFERLDARTRSPALPRWRAAARLRGSDAIWCAALAGRS